MTRNWRLMAALFAAAAMLTAACGGSEGSANEELGDGGPEQDGGEAVGSGGLSGSIEVDGSSTVAPLTDAVAEEYAEVAPDVIVNVGVSGTGGGFERFCNGETDIADASRPIKDEEAQICADNGIEYTELRVGTDALTMVTSPETDWVDCLTMEEVTKIFGEETPATTWSEVNPEFPDEPLEVFAPGTDSGTYDFMVEDVLGVEASRQDYNASEDDNIIAQGVIGTPGSWGFFGFAYFQESADQLKALEYDGGEGCVAPSVDTAQDDSYKMTRPLFIYVKNESLQRPEVEGFVTYYLDTVDSLIDEVGYIGVSEEDIDAAKSDLQSAVGG